MAQSYVFKNGTEIVQRRKPCVLRWVHFEKETDSEKYYRELLMLFKHWRNEEKDLIQNFKSFEESFKTNKIRIESRMENNMNKGVNLEEIAPLSHCSDENALFENVAPGCEHQNEMDREEGTTLSELYGCFDPGKHAPEYEIGIDMGISHKQLDEDIAQL